MTRTDRIRPEFVEFISKALEPGILYVSRKYQTASHLCCCGCRSKVVTPLKPGGWRVTTSRQSVSMFPSIGSWSLPCRSHYVIRDSRIEWAGQLTQAQIAAVQASDQRAREQYFDAPREGFWRRLFRRIFGR
jgi:hypothetical protein